jgi:glycosyltransferase involved in cell wall biosynthesis
MPKFSVIIPNYNHAAFLRQRINSVMNQTYQDFELIIIDDCSTDTSWQIIETYKNHEKISRIIRNETNVGSPFAQWKKGIQLAKGEWIWIAESDDLADTHFLEEALNIISLFPSVGLYYCDGIIQDENNNLTGKAFSVIKNQIFNTQKWSHSYCQNGITELNEYLKFDCTINNASSVVFKKAALNNITETLEAFKYYGDWYFYIQLCMVTDTCYSNKPFNIYRKHKKSLLNSPISSLTSRKEYFLILQLLYYNKEVTAKKYLLDHFCYHFLNLGLFSHSPRNSYRIIKNYLQIDKRLAFKVIPRLVLMKAFRKIYKNKVHQIDYIE